MDSPVDTDREIATAQSIAMKQMNFDSTVEEVSRKPPSLITQDDARVVQSTEVSKTIALQN